jgi:hypothetical protein
MAAFWNIQCPECKNVEENVQCSMFDIPKCTCGSERFLFSTKIGRSAVFPFTVNHVDGKPMVIESLNQLRSVEKQYGVVFSAFSKGNINDLDDISGLPRFRGDDEDVRRDNRNRYER